MGLTQEAEESGHLYLHVLLCTVKSKSLLTTDICSGSHYYSPVQCWEEIFPSPLFLGAELHPSNTPSSSVSCDSLLRRMKDYLWVSLSTVAEQMKLSPFLFSLCHLPVCRDHSLFLQAPMEDCMSVMGLAHLI